MAKAIFRIICAALLFVSVNALAQTGWWNKDWSERRQLKVDAGAASGAGRAPVLVRLHSGIVDFAQIADGGKDLRFVSGDGTPLNYWIERFDKSGAMALVWLDVPSAASTKDVWMYYGNPQAAAVSNPGAVYDGEQSLVLAFDQDTPSDQSANANRVAAFSGRPAEGVAGGGAAMQAGSELRLAPSASLTVPAGGKMTWSAWVRPGAESLQGQAAVYGKYAAGGSAPALAVVLVDGVPTLRVATGAEVQEARAGSPLAAGTWSHLAVTGGDGAVRLFVDGAQAAQIDAQLPAMDGEDVIGASAGIPGLVGEIDEVGRANTARDPANIALLAASQGRNASVVTPLGEPENRDAAGGAHGSYFGILFKALTVDAWVVILILLAMAILSWMVMVTKSGYLNRTKNANQDFAREYQELLRSQGRRAVMAEDTLNRYKANSTLARLYDIGTREVAMRRDGGALSPQSVAAIRSAMDAGLVREGQRLNARMVLLTIAISGGPFIGLLGTVLGVMITFAAVAAAGDVNINAIAPGIAAALLATVAGLAVAIPALFGYNWLLSRVEEVAADNQVFVDELEKRFAEVNAPGTAHRPA